VPSLLLRALIRAYQLLISPVLGPRCRYLPTCSEYAAEAVERHGALHGARLAALRLLRCHPWGGSGYDPVPESLVKAGAKAEPPVGGDAGHHHLADILSRAAAGRDRARHGGAVPHGGAS
jgi:putative membrane protein insertion efficiency factor